ncbi:MAG: PAS domain S-box protein [Dehalococcoidia bacterium]|nr:PAS domain S-box protein [Dehalococcoidia bacterium]
MGLPEREKNGPMLETHAIVMVDPAGVIRMWSPGAERLFGHDAASAVGRRST